MPVASFLSASTGSFQTENVHYQQPPSRSQGLGLCQVDRTSSCDISRDSEPGSSSPLFGLLCNNVLTSCLPFHGGGLGGSSCMHLPSYSGILTSHPHTALSCAKDISASKLAAAAFSALPVGSMLVVSSARAGAVPVTGSAPPHLYTLMLKGSTSPMSTSSAMPASLKGSGSG
jgi:hypothetical protein